MSEFCKKFSSFSLKFLPKDFEKHLALYITKNVESRKVVLHTKEEFTNWLPKDGYICEGL